MWAYLYTKRSAQCQCMVHSVYVYLLAMPPISPVSYHTLSPMSKFYMLSMYASYARASFAAADDQRPGDGDYRHRYKHKLAWLLAAER